MDWPKIKTMLILLFFVLNLFLIGSLQINENNKITIADTLISDTISILNNNNVTINEGVLSNKRIRIKGYYINTPEKPGESALKRLFGSSVSLSADSSGNSETTGDFGKFTITGISSVAFEGEWKKDNSFKLTQKSAQDEALKFATLLSGKNTTAKFDSIIEDKTQGVYTVTIKQMLGGYRIDDSTLVIIVSEKGIIKADGQWIMDPVYPYEEERICDELNAVLKSPSYISKGESLKITSVTPVYIQKRQSKYFLLYPAWKIETEKTSGYFDVFSGEYIK